jgi:hypothetical protein
MERPGWADTKPWEKFPEDVRADIRINDNYIKDLAPYIAHEMLVDAYLNAADENTRHDINIVGMYEGFCGADKFSLYYNRPRKILDETLLCPRRLESLSGEMFPGRDHWARIGDWRCCSFCGSMHPDDVIEAVKKFGTTIVSTCDKSYKRYIHLPNTPNAGFGPIKFYTMHFSDEQRKAFNDLLFSSDL